MDGDCRAFEIAKDTDSVEEWNATLIQNLDMDSSDVDDADVENILECLIHHRSLEHASDEENFLKWMNYMGRRDYNGICRSWKSDARSCEGCNEGSRREGCGNSKRDTW